jgi:phage portal protein BeeE
MAAQNFGGGTLYTVMTQALWTYICVRRIQQDIAGIPAIVQVRDRGGKKWREDPDHQLNEMLDRPYGNTPGAPRWSWEQALSAGVLRQELGGNQFWQKVDNGRELIALQLFLAELKGEPSNGVPTKYRVEGTSNTIPEDRVINIMHASPTSFWEGVAPTIANEQATRVSYAADRRARYDLETRIQPGVVFKVKALFTMSDAQRENTKAMLANAYEGATNAGKSLVVGDDTTIEGAPLHQVGDIPKQAESARDEIISSFGVSPPTVGVLRDVRYQSWEQALRAQWTLCIEPRLRNIYGTINSQAIYPLYGRQTRLWYDQIQSPLGLAAIRERGESAKIYLDLGYPGNAVNEFFQLGMPEFEELERPNMGAVIAGHAEDAGVTEQDEPEVEPEPAEEEDAA